MSDEKVNLLLSPGLCPERKLRYKKHIMSKCGRCGGRLRRVHRTFLERLSYMAIYQCRDCHAEECVPRRYRYHFGQHCRCPECGTTRLTKLKERDHIDRMQTGLLNLLERLANGKLYHCCFCRLQFYDRRKLEARAVQEPEKARAAAAVTTPPGTAISGV